MFNYDNKEIALKNRHKLETWDSLFFINLIICIYKNVY